MNLNYLRGYRKEIQIKHKLEELGYRVIRSAKSGGPADLIAAKNKQTLLIQVKYSKNGYPHINKNETEELKNWALEFNAKPIIWLINNRMEKLINPLENEELELGKTLATPSLIDKFLSKPMKNT